VASRAPGSSYGIWSRRLGGQVVDFRQGGRRAARCAAESGRVGGLRVCGNWQWLRAREESARQDFPPRGGRLQGPIQNERGNREGNRERAQVVRGRFRSREETEREIERRHRSSRARFKSREETEMERERAQAAGTWNPRRWRSAHPAASVPCSCSSPAVPSLFTLAFLCSAFPSAGLLVAHWYLFLSRPLLCSLRHAWTLDMLCSCSSVLPEVGYEHTVV